MIVADDAADRVAVNDAAGALFGRPRAGLVGTALPSWIHPAADVPAAGRRRLDAGEARGLLPVISADGARRPVAYRASARIADGRHLVVMRALTEPSAAAREAFAGAERAFDPFFSTKETGQGTGLGLATVYGIVRQSGGEVWLHSEPGRGTTVTLCLPGTESPAESMRPGPAQARREGRGETVLVVEDEALVRRLAVQLLPRHGYRVIEAIDGQAGLRAWEEAAGEIRLVLTDVVMPGIDGVEMSRRIVALDPTARTLFMTAWSGDALPTTMQRYAAVLDKPFTTEALLVAVRHALDRR